MDVPKIIGKINSNTTSNMDLKEINALVFCFVCSLIRTWAAIQNNP